MPISAPDRSIPGEILGNVLQIEKDAYVKLRIGKYEEAEGLFKRELSVFMEWQEEIHRPIHKGSPLHMIGICHLLQNTPEIALKFFLLAYIEDTLNAGFEMESEADLAPASMMLRNVFQIDPGYLRKIREYVARLKHEGAWERAKDPGPILKAAVGTGHPPVRIMPKVLPKTPIDPLPGTWDKRVFVGGDYDHLAVLKAIQEAVIESGFQPILPYDCLVPPDKIHHHDLMLLHCCRLGIFEVSSPAGQLMEIERAKDYDVQVILFYTDRDGPPHSLSTMVSTAGYTMDAYSDIPDLKQKVRKWLSKF